MDPRQIEIAALVGVFVGIPLMFIAACDWKLFYSLGNAKMRVTFLGRTGARVVDFMIGAAGTILGLLYLIQV